MGRRHWVLDVSMDEDRAAWLAVIRDASRQEGNTIARLTAAHLVET